MPSFDVVSEVDAHELRNAVDQASREIGTRFDFKGVDAQFELKEGLIELRAEAEFQLQQMLEILRGRMARRDIDVACLEIKAPRQTGKVAHQEVVVRQGVDAELARRIVRLVKDSKIKAQAAIQGDQVRISGKKRDDLQQIIALLKNAGIELPLQYVNFRD